MPRELRAGATDIVLGRCQVVFVSRSRVSFEWYEVGWGRIRLNGMGIGFGFNEVGRNRRGWNEILRDVGNNERIRVGIRTRVG